MRVGTISVLGLTRTRREVVVRELLFQPGDLVDSSAVAESGRNLRRLLYLSNTEIRLLPRPGQAPSEQASATPDTLLVDAEIRVAELYARALSPLISGDLEELSYGVVALDYNLFGRGGTGRLVLHHDAITGNEASLLIGASRLRESQLDLQVLTGLAAEGHDLALGLSRPFRRLSDPWACGVVASSSEADQRLYSSGRLVARYTDRYNGARVWVTRSLGDRVKVRPGLILSLSDRRSEAARGFSYTPQDRRRILPSASLLVWRPRYVRARFIHALGPTEDLQTGSWASLRVGLSHRGLGSDRTYPFASLLLSPRRHVALGSVTYLYADLSLSSRYRHGGYENLVASGQVLAYAQVRERHTAALRLRLETLSRPETESQFLLGVNTGLRGFLPRQWDGTRRLVANAEVRPVFWQRPLFVLGAAAFVDAGAAWTPDESAFELQAGFGGGIRLGLPTVYATPVLRLDLARGMGGIGQLAFGVGQYF
ncbi:hypothetical protein ACFL6X_00395 [Candidatus Latescibacterota bacterium]